MIGNLFEEIERKLQIKLSGEEISIKKILYSFDTSIEGYRIRILLDNGMEINKELDYEETESLLGRFKNAYANDLVYCLCNLVENKISCKA
jgi:hypothetical protein